MEGTWEELFAFLEQLGNTMDRLTEIARTKTNAVMRDDLNGVNECMKQEQVISLTLRSMEIKRGKLLGRLGLGDVPMRALPEHCPERLRLKARAVTERVRNQFLLYRSAEEVSRTTLEVNLHQIEKIISEQSGQEPQRGSMADIRA